jgi:bifunctional non-homologous end joining protein LigD
MNEKIPFRARPMLATLVGEPFHDPRWTYEEKYDGIRILAYKEGAQVTLLSRNGKDRTGSFPAIARAIGALRPATLVLDGEVVALDRHKISRFQWLQRGIGRARYAVFDCLYVSGRDLRHEPLSNRRAELERVEQSDDLILSRRLSVNGLQAFGVAKRRGYEGLVAKRLASVYIEGRSREWLKVKVHQEDEFIIVGYTEPSGSREYFGALLLGAYRHGKLQYVGKVGTGFTRDVLALLYRRFRSLKRKHASVDLLRFRGATFLMPKLVAQISYTEWTKDRKLRHPVFLGLRDDKDPRDVVFPEAK